MWIALLVLGGLCLGGVISFYRTRMWPGVIITGLLSVLAFGGALAWMPR